MENSIPFTQENFDKLVKQNAELLKALQGIINGCVHPNFAVRAVMVDLTPIRKVIQNNTYEENKTK